jgi:C_GCAxxG_C_C family probable redox protein
MKKHLKRRDFLGSTALLALSTATLGACTSGGNPPVKTMNQQESGENNFSSELAKNRQMPRDLVMKMLDQKVDQYMQLSHHCAQSSFMAVKEQFGLDGEQVIKALTPLPGIAERGETCGAITGPLMAMGLIYGRDKNHLDDWETYRKSLVPTGRFCEQFQEEYGTTLCSEVQKVEFGRCYQLTDPDELQEFQNDGATEHCSAVVRSAVHMAAAIILDDPSLS